MDEIDERKRRRRRRTRVPTDAPPLTEQERRSLTRTELRLAEGARRTYGDALRTLNRAEIPFVLSGLFSVYAYTGISRRTKDLDLLMEPEHLVPAARALSDAGFETVLEERHWLAKAHRGGRVVDLVFGMANGLWMIDEMWYRRGIEGRLCGEPIRIAAPEDLIFHRLFITERHRFDMSDIVHLILVRGEHLDWRWLLRRVGEHWRLLFAQVLFFEFSYPGRRGLIPDWVRNELQERLRAESAAEGAPGKTVHPDDAACMGTLISRFSFAVDVNEWGFEDRRARSVRAARERPIVREIEAAGVWDVRRGDGAATPRPPEEGADGEDDDADDEREDR